MKIISTAVEHKSESRIAVKAKATPRQTLPTSARLSKRDRTEFDRGLIFYVRAVKSSVRSEYDVKEIPEPGISSDEITAEIERLKSRTPRASEVSTQSTKSTPAEGRAAVKTTERGVSDDKTTERSAADMLAEQKKQISELLSDKSDGLSKNVIEQLEKIYKLLCEQEKTDPNSISKPLQKEIDKLSEIISSEKSKTDKSVYEMLEDQRDKLNALFSRDKKRDTTLSGIKNKIRQGQKLTETERRYLSAKDPSAYESYCKINTARTMFRCSLNNCRTRDDVIGMRLSNALSALSSYKKAIREGGDGSQVIALNAAFENELRSFSKSSGYRSLPTTAECNKFDRDLAKARQYEREKRLEKQREVQRLRSKKYKKVKNKTPGDGKRTVAQVLADPVSKKVLASRAKQTYCECSSVSFSMYKTLNSKA